MRTLYRLIFDATEAADGSGSFDAMASASAAAWPALQAELAMVLGWAHARFPEGHGPLDEGFDWDLDLQATQERSRVQHLAFDPDAGALRLLDGGDSPAETVRHTVSLSLSGSADFCAAFQARFGRDDADTTR